LPNFSSLPIHVFVGRIAGFIPAQSIWCLGIAGLLGLVLNRHVFGNNVLFIGDDIRTARLMGINTDSGRILLFVFMGFIIVASVSVYATLFKTGR
jgi:simple sugar transport system permease protein